MSPKTYAPTTAPGSAWKVANHIMDRASMVTCTTETAKVDTDDMSKPYEGQ